MNTKQHLSLTLLLAAAPLARAQSPGAPPAIEPVTPDATPGLSLPSATPPAVPPPAGASVGEPAADELLPPPAAGAGGPPGNRPSEKPLTPPAPRRVQNEHPAPVLVPRARAVSPDQERDPNAPPPVLVPRARAVSPSPGVGGYFNGVPYGTAATPMVPAPPTARAEQIIRDTKLKVLQSHYETALSELMTAERALIDATDDKRPAMETRLKGLKGFVDKLEADIQKLAAAPSSDAPAAPRGVITGRLGREVRPEPPDEAAEPASAPAPRKR